MKIGFCFAGQGAQFVGMGQDFYNQFPLAKEIYDKFPEIRDLCFNGDPQILNQTKYAQKAMMLTSYVIASVLRQHLIEPQYVCGLSLGEYSALLFSDVFTLDEAIDIISNRGEIMQNALPLGYSKMAAIIGLSRDVILDQIKDIDGVCEIANYNCPGQIVITGLSSSIDEACLKLKEAGARRAIVLNVSGAFHSSLLEEASLKLRKVLDKYTPKQPKYKVVYNISGKEENKNINDILQLQIKSSVFFEDQIRYMISKGVDTFVEIGPGQTLKGFINKISTKVNAYSVTNVSSFNEVIEAMKDGKH